MTELHEALKYLGPVDWNDVPTEQHEDLKSYTLAILEAGELICNSLPPLADGTPFNAAKPHYEQPNTAKSHKEIHPSEARPYPPRQEHVELSKGWGKPMKFGKDANPLKVAVYKMAGKDRHGAWFARQSVHEGLGFDKFKRAMMREFSESMQVQGGPGAGAVRGIAADRRLERIDVPGLGKLEIYELSAQFPGPVTPRDFMTMLISSDNVLSEKSAAEVEGGEKHVPRHFMIVSKPVEHPDAPERSGFVRGHYESVEMIREIPLSTAKSKANTELLRKQDKDSKQNGSEEGSDEPELNPVEWTMITRSDPGGGIPRFLVDRGTPEAMLQDVHKFFNWACALDEIAHPDEDLEQQMKVSAAQAEKEKQEESGSAASFNKDGKAPTSTADSTQEITPRQFIETSNRPNRGLTEQVPSPGQTSAQGGLVSSLTGYLEAGIDAYAPTSVSSMVHSRLHPDAEDLSSDSSDTSSIDSFMSAEELGRAETAPEAPGPQEPVDTLSMVSGNRSEESLSTKGMTHHEKEVHKLAKKRERLDQALAKKRAEQEQKVREAQEKEQSEAEKAKDKADKEMKKTEEKHRKEIEKLEAKKAKEAKKVEEKRKKKEEQNTISRVSRERDEFRSQMDLYRRENTLLRDQVADLQRQNTLLARKLGPEAVKSLEDEFGRRRSGSIKSVGSGSGESTRRKS